MKERIVKKGCYKSDGDLPWYESGISDLAVRTKRREQINHKGQLVYPGPTRKVKIKGSCWFCFIFQSQEIGLANY